MKSRNKPWRIAQVLWVLILGTRFKFGKSSDLWANEARNRLLYAPAFVKTTGMSRNRFGDIWYALVFSDQGYSVDSACSATECVTRIGGSCEEVRRLYAPD
jgi:hypothetical protein